MSKNIKRRATTVAGDFYPDDPDKLTKMIKDSLSAYTNDKVDSPLGIIVPNSSYQFASDVFAAGYSQILGEEYDTVIIISPIHKIAFPFIALSDSDCFTSPLGDLYIDKKANEFLNKFREEFIVYKNEYHLSEYSIEVQLPYISTVLKKDVKILPIIIGESNTKFTVILSQALCSLMEKKKKKYLIIVTTNLSHNIKYEEAVKTDNKFISILFQINPDHMSEQLALGEIKARGGGGVITLLRLAQLLKIDNIRVLKLLNSGDVNGEKHKVEGYMSGVMW